MTTTRLRALLTAPEILVMQRVHDALSGRIIERVGFDVVTVGGAGDTIGWPTCASRTRWGGIIDSSTRFCLTVGLAAKGRNACAIGVTPTRWSMADEDHTGTRNLWLRAMDATGPGFDS